MPISWPGGDSAAIPSVRIFGKIAHRKLDDQGAAFPRDIWLVTHRDLKRSGPVRAVMDYLAKAFENAPWLSISPTLVDEERN